VGAEDVALLREAAHTFAAWRREEDAEASEREARRMGRVASTKS
jgi:hypothetical protein